MSACTLSWSPRSLLSPAGGIGPGETHLWRARWSTAVESLGGECLDPAERRRAMRLIMPEQRKAFVFARIMLRVVLGAYLSADPALLRFETASGGKPALPGQKLRFSVSHSADGVLLALTHGNEVGVDLERADRKLDADALATASLSAAEHSDIDAMDKPARRRAILRMWTRKEALLKADGNGLACDPRDLTLQVANAASPATHVRHGGRVWTLTDLPVGDAWQASLAVEGQAAALRGYCLGW